MSNVSHVEAQDIAAAIVAILVIAGEVALSLLRIPIPSELGTAQGAVLTWLFMRSAQQVEAHRADTIDGLRPNS